MPILYLGGGYIVWFRIMQAVKRNLILKYVLGIPVYLIHRHYEYKYNIHMNINIDVGEGFCLSTRMEYI